MSDWKPGDVAMVTMTHRGGDTQVYRAMFDGCNEEWVDGKSGRLYPGGVWPITDVRPLVVIDPEDVEQVERLVAVLDEWGYRFIASPAQFDPTRDSSCVMAALREFANPTPLKPDEPLGEWAVVLDVEGNVWTRMNDVHWSSEASPRNRQTYAEIDVVRVLSEGVRP